MNEIPLFFLNFAYFYSNNDYGTNMETQDDAFAFMQFYGMKLLYSIIAFVYNLDKIIVQLARIQCKSEAQQKWHQNFGIFFEAKNVQIYTLK